MSQLNVGSINATGVITCRTPPTTLPNVGAVNVMANAGGGNPRITFMNSAGDTIWSRLSADSTGNSTFTGNVTAFSDERLKENIEEINDPLQKVLSIRGVTFTRNDLSDKTKRHIGVIAQEIEKILPEVVHDSLDHDSDGNPIEIKTVAYGNIVSVLIEAIKEQNKEIEDLKERVKILENK
jgi:hypothetical protein